MYNVAVLGDSSYATAFNPSQFHAKCFNWDKEKDEIDYLVEQSDLICFTGGEDVNPSFYGSPDYLNQQDMDHYNDHRDFQEAQWYRIAKYYEKPCVGICRGAQFLNVMNGGKMLQHVDGHHESHLAFSYTDPGATVTVSSDHHQMMIPTAKAEMLLYSIDSSGHLPTSSYLLLPKIPGSTDSSPIRVDPEALLYRETRDLCHQPHPEWQEPTSTYWKYFNYTTMRLLEL